ncbi:MCE family protein [Tomitella biformata]|uniref:MCE family protein n=1 Tax=Tomitella biformata TaxID=630403 RepID=UPI000463D3F0|nr:MCE family protein [Tomitella biformata]
MKKLPRLAPLVIGAVALALVAIAGGAWHAQSSTKHVIAYFDNTTGLYPGDPVNVLGVKVGAVTAITPEGDRVKVEMTYDKGRKIPADAQAVIIAPTLVSGRYVQFAPAYTQGEVLTDHAIVPLERTIVPVSFDEEKQQLTELVDQLGPNGTDSLNPDGTLNSVLAASSDALRGHGELANGTLKSLSAAAETLATSGPDLFTTVRNLQSFVSELAANDRQIVGFSDQLSQVSHLLNSNRTELDVLLGTLAAEMGQVQSVIGDNHEKLVSDVIELQNISQLLVNRQDDLAQILHTAPTTLGNFYNIYDPQTKSLTGGLALPDLPDARSLFCVLATTVNAPQEACATAGKSLQDQLTAGLVERDGAGQTLASLLLPPTDGGPR